MKSADEEWNWDKLRGPDSSYRSVPLWSWNDKLEIAELERQIEEMNRAGIGGFFMHARGGLQTPYMGEEWMEAIRSCIEKAESLGMEPWFYDENGWPSGFGGGRVPALGLVYQQKKLVMERAPFTEGDRSRDLGYYVSRETGWLRLQEESSSEAEVRIYWEVNPFYIDTLSQKAVRAFIDSTYEAYWEKFGDEFRHVLKGVFTDEPQFGRGEIPWSFELDKRYAERYGSSVLDILPGLFMDTANAKEHRYRFWSCVTELFVSSYAKQIGDWCEDKGWSLAGHVVDEQTLMGQSTSVGDLMSFYEYMQIPGCDWLGRFVGEEPLVPKQVGSVARQLGKKRTITESYGCSGWNASMQDLKRIGEWQFVHGINMMCQHLQSYSLRGLRKRDYPPSLFYQQPWWSEYRHYNDYFARLSMLLAEGERQAEVLLLHPIRSAWVEQQGFDSSAIRPYHEAFADLSRQLCRSFLEHDYGSESILERHGIVKGGQLIVGQAAYSAVIMPPSVTWSRSTVELLIALLEQGGSVTIVAPFPTLLEGKQDVLLERLTALATSTNDNAAITNIISQVVAPFASLRDISGDRIESDTINIQTLKLGDSWLYYIVNSGESGCGDVEIELRSEGNVTILNLETGTEEMLPQVQKDGFVRVTLPLAAAQSYMLRQRSEAVAGNNQQSASIKEAATIGQTLMLDGAWQVKQTELNSLTLDTCRVSIEGGDWSEPQPVIFLQEKLLELGRSARIACEFVFHAAFDTGRAREMYLIMERPDTAAITLNGVPISNEDCGWWLDTAFKKLDLRGMVHTGENRLIIESEFYNAPETYEAMERAKTFESEGNKLTFDTELESVYLLGDFGVESLTPFVDGGNGTVLAEGPFVLTEMPVLLAGGDFVRQGFPFYAGRLTVEQKVSFENVLADSEILWSFTTPPDAIVAKLRINGREVKTFQWEPYEADIGPFLVTGDNVIELELAGSCRNLLGPHHHMKGEPLKIGPDSFTNKVGWTDRDLPPDTQVYQDRYAFVRFGLSASPRMTIKHITNDLN
ncbi:glycosyl hydrolase [Paenibacillus sp. 2TAB19]|uniref:glycosyl hydrolase n=1 Tax=Paenibacillus sp. 2TAB19 TaxID=3233003 RepID=UPI003F973F2E